MFQTKVLRKLNTHFMFKGSLSFSKNRSLSFSKNRSLSFSKNRSLFFSKIRHFFLNRAFYEIMWKKYSTSGQATDGNMIQCVCIACWITKATDTHSEYVILIALPLQLWLHGRAPVLSVLPVFLAVHNLR